MAEELPFTGGLPRPFDVCTYGEEAMNRNGLPEKGRKMRLKATEQKQENLVSVTDMAIRHQTTYNVARDSALKGTWGTPVRVGSRLFVVNPDFKPAA
jgi:hypothetical protein